MADAVRFDRIRMLKEQATNPDRRDKINRILTDLGKFAVDSAVNDSLKAVNGHVSCPKLAAGGAMNFPFPEVLNGEDKTHPIRIRLGTHICAGDDPLLEIQIPQDVGISQAIFDGFSLNICFFAETSFKMPVLCSSNSLAIVIDSSSQETNLAMTPSLAMFGLMYQSCLLNLQLSILSFEAGASDCAGRVQPFKHQPPSPSLNDKKSEDLKLVMEELQAMMEETQEDMHKAKQGNKISAKSVSTSENPELQKKTPNEGNKDLHLPKMDKKRVFIHSRL
uniref:Uncharacterized protein n=1 Tax=Quercus lobata TaxID=97700 RepID=A0A7N2MAG3_QUELO